MQTDTKTALLDSAEAAVRARGFDGFSYADLSADVGIRKASIHHHFPTKAALAHALMMRYCEVLAEACTDINAAHATGGARLSAIIALYREASASGQQLCLCLSFATSPDRLPDGVKTLIVGFRQSVLDWLGSVFALGRSDGSIIGVIDDQAEAAAAMAVLEGAQLACRVEEDITRFDIAIRQLSARARPAQG
ncbi:TetR/AcrR family transcriptional regulator [uncultured Tateyamaria sp.]|uniref:TetR/AcrR family transcriptional regulator n=1 Tax=uncultured Tateyamaria sp. TaxID=455651 RepID=UPI00260A4F2B|nr:TetR/AcrR family transcriptional regulator [uncultured Tateyamaria sp.]